MDRSPSIQRPFRDATRIDRLRQDLPREEKVRVSQIEQKADRIKELAERQFEGSWNRRLNNEVGRLQRRQSRVDGPRPPIGSRNEPVEVTASRNIQNRHMQRLRRVETIRDRMQTEGQQVGTGRISANRFGAKRT